jgi:hypothetical protein
MAPVISIFRVTAGRRKRGNSDFYLSICFQKDLKGEP